jgi:hypothetical protein
MAPGATLRAVLRTWDECTLVGPEEDLVTLPSAGEAPLQRGFRALRLVGPLPFDAVGILARLAAPLAAADIPILALSSYDTDVLLVRETALERALAALESGFDVRR